MNRDACLASFRADCEAVIAAFNTHCAVIEQSVRDGVQSRQLEFRALREAATGCMWRADVHNCEALAAVLAPGESRS